VTATADPGKEARAASGIPVVGAFDAYRALAIAGVVLFHVVQVSGVLGEAGDSAAGVLMWGILPGGSLTTLFIVSGFVMFLPAAVRGGDLGSRRVFAVRRAARLVPAYWLSLVIALLLLAAYGPGLPGIGPIAAHVAILQTPALLVDGPVFVDGATVGSFPLGLDVIPPVWTLSVEIGFYVVLAFVAGAYYRRPFIGLALAAAALVAWHLLAVNLGDVGAWLGIDVSAATEARFRDYYASQLPSWGLALACGMTGAWLYVRVRERVERRLLERWGLWALGATAVIFAAVVWWAGESAVDDPNPFLGLFARQPLALSLVYPLALGAVMLSLSLAPLRLQRPVDNPPIRWFADISYSVYLIHFAVIWFALNELSLPVAAEDGSIPTLLAWSALVFAASTVYAYLSARFLERPVRRWARRYRPRAKRDAARAATSGAAGPPVSIVIPTYNRREWLGGALDSVLEQDYENIEAVVVDDGSADGTADLLRDYSRRWPRRRFRWLRQANAGQARAINRGNEVARGDILGYLSDDDVLLPGAVSRLAAELITDPTAAAAYPGYREIDAEGRVEDTIRPVPYSPRAALRLHDTVIGPGGLARRWALERAGGWDPELRWMGDLLMWMGVGLAGDVVRVGEPLACWRRHPGSATLQPSAEHAREHLRVVEIGAGLDGMGALSTAERAEATRNACFFGAFLGGSGDTWPGERFVVFDLHRRLLSATTSKLGPDGEIDWAEAERSAALYRELVEEVAAGAERPEAGTGGLEVALARLRGIGVIGARRAVDAAELRLGLIEAAFACGAETEPGTNRFVIVERGRARVSGAELDEVIGLGFASSADELSDALSRLRARQAQPGSARG
jgi:peptidoglycan/LPS O-acetylase OafA/YrhL